jgi:hypothetical protein
MIDIYRNLTQDEVRGLFTNSTNTNVAHISFPPEFKTVVSVLTASGHRFDMNFGTGLKRVIEMASENGVELQYDACEPIAKLELPTPRSEEEALDMQEEAIHGSAAPVESDLTVEVTDGRQERAKESKMKKK